MNLFDFNYYYILTKKILIFMHFKITKFHIDFGFQDFTINFKMSK